MSSDAFQAFLKKVEEDEDLRRALDGASGEKGIPAETFLAMAAERGYEFTVDDVSDELNDAELDAVAGGLARTMVRTQGSLLGFKVEIEGVTNQMGTLFLKLSHP